MEQTIPGHNPTILDYWRILCRFKWLIIGLVVVSVLMTGIVSKLSTRVYAAKATVLPAKETLAGGGISLGSEEKEKGGSPSLSLAEAVGAKAGPTALDMLQAILLSRGMAEAVVAQLDLMQYYSAKSLFDAVSALQGETEVKLSKFKMVEVTVETRDPQMAANIANAYASHLDRLNKEFSTTASKRGRLFIEARLAEKAKKLAEAESALARFENENRVRPVGKESAQVTDLGIAATLHEQIMELEVQLAALREYALPSHPMINQLEAQIQALRKHLDRLEQEQVRGMDRNKRPRVALSKKLYPAFEEATALQFDLLRLTRQVKVEEAVNGLLVGMLEQAKIAEAKDLPTIQVLEPAIPPQRHSKPQTLKSMEIAFVISLVLGILLALFLSYWERLKALEANSVPRVADGGELPAYDPNGDGARTGVPSVQPKQAERLHG
jgi:uncharacterized protein involved in exopolysaccharide biosynthesis